MHAKLLQSTLFDPMDCSPPGSSVHGILQPRILEWVAMPSSRGSSWLRDRTWVSWLADRFFTLWATRETLNRSFYFTWGLFLWKRQQSGPKHHLAQGSTTSGLWMGTCCQISSGIRLEIKFTINAVCLNHPGTILPTPCPWKWCLPRNRILVLESGLLILAHPSAPIRFSRSQWNDCKRSTKKKISSCRPEITSYNILIFACYG